MTFQTRFLLQCKPVKNLYNRILFFTLCILFLIGVLIPSVDSDCKYADVTLIIPLTATYLNGNCVENVLYYYRYGTLVPKQVILVVSQVNVSDPSNMVKFDQISREWKSTGLNLTILVREGVHSPGSNKNYGLKIRSQPIVTFFDVDDVPHPQRIEQIASFFENDPTLDVFLHGFKKMDRDSFPYFLIKIKENEFEAINPRYTYTSDQLRPVYAKYYQDNFANRTVIKNTRKVPIKWCCELLDRKIMPANGWSSWRSHIFDKLEFNNDLFQAEDTLINMQALWSGYNLKVSNHFILGFYNFHPLRRAGVCPHVLIIKQNTG